MLDIRDKLLTEVKRYFFSITLQPPFAKYVSRYIIISTGFDEASLEFSNITRIWIVPQSGSYLMFQSCALKCRCSRCARKFVSIIFAWLFTYLLHSSTTCFLSFFLSFIFFFFHGYISFSCSSDGSEESITAQFYFQWRLVFQFYPC